MTLVGLGVRTVSFIGIKVYSVGFYADLNNPDLKVTILTAFHGQLNLLTGYSYLKICLLTRKSKVSCVHVLVLSDWVLRP